MKGVLIEYKNGEKVLGLQIENTFEINNIFNYKKLKELFIKKYSFNIFSYIMQCHKK